MKVSAVSFSSHAESDTLEGPTCENHVRRLGGLRIISQAVSRQTKLPGGWFYAS